MEQEKPQRLPGWGTEPQKGEPSGSGWGNETPKPKEGDKK